MSLSEEALLRLVGMAYDAALDESKWPLFLDAFASAVGGSSSILRSADLHTNKAGFVASVGYDPAWQSAYCDHFVKHDFVVRALYELPAGEVRTNAKSFSPSVLNKSEIYNDYYLPQDKAFAMGSLLIKDGSQTLLFSAQRGKHAGEWSEKEIRLMKLLAPHVTRAVQVHRKLGGLATEKDSALGALDQLRMGVILTNNFGNPLFVNRAAEQMLVQGEGIRTHQGGLVLSKAAETATLYKLIADASQGAPGTTRGGEMRIALHGDAFLHCLVTPIPLEISTRWDIAMTSGCVAVFLSKPSGLQLPPKRLAAMYGLSPAEARLAAKLAAFRNMEEAADDLCISVLTARTQLKSVFAKTGAKGQSELLMLLATGTLAHCRNGE